MPLAEGRGVTLRTRFFESESVGCDHSRKVRMNAVFDAGLVYVIEVRLAVVVAVKPNDVDHAINP